MREGLVGPDKIVGVRIKAGVVTDLDVKMVDGRIQHFIPVTTQPAPVITSGYVGRHEKTAGGWKKHGS